MKNILTILSVLLILFSKPVNAQVGGIGGGEYEMVFVPGAKEDKSQLFKKIAPKMYTSIGYFAAEVEGINKSFFLRYNIYRDEMEFLKNGETFYLNKNENIKIIFSISKEEYRLFKLNDKLQYFTVHNNENPLLLTRKIVEYQDAQIAASSYQKDKLADFNRKDDEIYILFEKTLIEIPRSSKKFRNLFGEQSSFIKQHIKKNRLNIKKIEDLKTIIKYYNTL
jgi:hypothetical protein